MKRAYWKRTLAVMALALLLAACGRGRSEEATPAAQEPAPAVAEATATPAEATATATAAPEEASEATAEETSEETPEEASEAALEEATAPTEEATATPAPVAESPLVDPAVQPQSPLTTPGGPMDSPLAPSALIPFAPDATWPEGEVIFVSDASGAFEIYSVVDGGPPTSLTAGLGSAVEPALSPDGTQIAFARYNPEDSGNLLIYVMNADGSDPRPVMEEQPELNWRPTWSPDGSQLLFISNRDGPTDMNIYRVNLDGSDLTNMTGGPQAAHDIDPDWSPDGSQIVFASDRDHPKRGIYIMNADGTDVREIPGPDCLCAYPRWSPDGSKILYAEKGKTGSWEIFVMNPDGSERQQVTENSDTFLAEWLGDDQLLTQGVGWLTEDHELFLVDLESGERTQLTLTPKAGESFPSWKP